MHNFDAYLGGNRPLIRTITPLYVTRSCQNQETETNVFTSLVNTTQISGKARKKIVVEGGWGVGGGSLLQCRYFQELYCTNKLCFDFHCVRSYVYMRSIVATFNKTLLINGKND